MGDSQLSQTGGWAGMLGGGVAALDSLDGEMSGAGSFASGALSGVAAGSALGPWGMLAGGAIGGVTSLLMRNRQKREMEEQKRHVQEMRKKQELNMRKTHQQDLDSRFNVNGMDVPGFYAKGGPINDPEADPRLHRRLRQMMLSGKNPDEIAQRIFDPVAEIGETRNLQKIAENYGSYATDRDRYILSYSTDESGERLSVIDNPKYSVPQPTAVQRTADPDRIVRNMGERSRLGQMVTGQRYRWKTVEKKALGGPAYEAEGGETIQHDPAGVPVTYNGALDGLSSDMSEIVGPSHQAGGVKMSGGERIFSDQLTVSKQVVKHFKKNL